MKITLTSITLLLFAFQVQASRILVSGQLNTNTIWKADTVIIQGALEIKNGVLLTIAPGVSVMGGNLDVKGAIQALGRADSLINFKHQYIQGGSTNYFGGFNFTNVASANDSSVFNYCSFESLVPNDALFVIRNSNQIEIKNCFFDGADVQGRMLLSAYQSDVKFNKNVVKHFKERAVEFTDGNATCNFNMFDSCLNYRYGEELVYFGAGKQLAKGNVFSHCGDSLNPSDINPTVIFRNGSECEFRENSLLNSWNLALRIEDESAPIINNCTIKNYNAGILFSKTHSTKSVTILNTVIDGIAEIGMNAGIDVRATIRKSTIKNCKKGGVVVVRDSDFKFLNDSFLNNAGGGCNIRFTTTTAEFENCYFEGNSANFGGGLFITDRAICTINNCTFKSNLAVNGGGMAAGSGSSIQNCTFNQNEAYSFGGGAFVQGCTFINNKLVNNKAYMGGGALFQMSTSYRGNYENNYISENTADSLGGGAIIAIDRYMKFRNNHIENNTAGFAGGGLSVYVGSKSWMSGIMINNNEAPFGAGINFEENTSHNLKLSNMSVLYNRSTKKYGALRNKSKDELYFTNCVFWGNESDNGLDFYSEWDNADPGFDHCVIQGGFSNFDLNGGTFNGAKIKISTTDPEFNKVTKAGNDSLRAYNYYFSNTSDLYNGGKADTSKLRIARRDLNNTLRVKDSKIDIGTYEFVEMPKLNIWIGKTEICENSTPEINITPDSRYDEIDWYKDGEKLLSNKNKLSIDNFSKSDTGYYWAVGSNAAGQVYSDTLHFSFISTPTVKLIGNDTTLCQAHDYRIEAEGNWQEYLWKSHTAKKSSFYVPLASEEVWVMVKDKETGCFTISDTISIEIINPSFVADISLGYDVGLEEYNLTADLESNDGFDSILWQNITEQWQQVTAENYLKVELSNGEGEYVANTFIETCAGDTSKGVTIVFPSVGSHREFAIDIIQIAEMVQLSTELNQELQLQLYNLDGKRLISTQFKNQTQIDVTNYRNQILLIKVFDAETSKLWIDKVFIN
ncbi:MAG: right-handed parallel beta-helix repeat-containing protein [Bacteroidia bacterium]